MLLPRIVVIVTVLAQLRFAIQDGHNNGNKRLGNKNPYIVNLVKETNRQCKGTVITSNWVLTAARCFVQSSHVQYSHISKSPTDSQTKQETRKILKMIKPSGNYLIAPDIGLLYIDKLAIEAYGSLSAVDYKALLGLPVEYLNNIEDKDPKNGKEFKRNEVETLQSGEGIVITCDRKNYTLMPHICVAYKCSSVKHPAQQDAGDPLFLNGKVIAVHTDDSVYSRIRYYTPISPYLSWISYTINGSKNDSRRLKDHSATILASGPARERIIHTERLCVFVMPGVSTLVLVAAMSTCSLASPVNQTSDHQPPFTHRSETKTKHPKLKSDIRVQNGEDDTTDKYPYVVAVLLENKYKTCSGTAILPTWVLSSAHCKSPFYVQYGDMTVARENITLVTEILKVIKHPSYRSYQNAPKSTTYNDIGLMFVQEIKLQSVAELSALDYRTLLGYEVEYAGYGMTHLSDIGTLIDHQKPLQIGRGMIGSCKDVQVLLIFNPKLCVVPQCKTSQSALPGDSGGPVLVDGKVVGINVGIVYTSMISIFTPLSPYLAWIYKVISYKPA